MDSYPSSLRKGDRVMYRMHGDPLRPGEVVDVFPNGAFIGEVDQHGVRLLRKADWCPDDGGTIIEEVNGESLF